MLVITRFEASHNDYQKPPGTEHTRDIIYCLIHSGTDPVPAVLSWATEEALAHGAQYTWDIKDPSTSSTFNGELFTAATGASVMSSPNFKRSNELFITQLEQYFILIQNSKLRRRKASRTEPGDVKPALTISVSSIGGRWLIGNKDWNAWIRTMFDTPKTVVTKQG